MTLPVSVQDTSNMVNALKANAERLGLVWTIRFGTVVSIASGVTYVRLDGGAITDNPQIAVPLCPQPATDCRVSCFVTSPTDVYIVSANPSAGTLIGRWRRTTNQTINNATNTFIDYDTADYDPYRLLTGTTLTNITPPFEGWYWLAGRAVWVANATSRRGFFINTNGSTAGAGTISGQSLQAPATGSCQITAGGVAYFNGTDDFFSGRVIQNSGVALDLDGSIDGGSDIEAIYLGSPNV